MEKNKNASGKLNQLSVDQKLDLFKVEELEDRLEMAAISAFQDQIDINGTCWQS